ncbi:glycosyltransferase family 4 protein [Citrobacter freundii]|uniref:glycosyltransferase family 4 protein n=1 Tax=Citrobacter freundii TaxID=546 RepID=UPI0015A90EE9|nr:glycosyltransferase family 4 protein [Citrobacter freundii]MDV1855025.1 glycosyltransferase family 4 protein [Citrobacter freundii]MEB0416219.1 glycosyltransferase family 4 protein [Citrobacter freundii]MEB0913382.1 glycosyltransferase family 4 protein [Citrobacter freundii]QLD06734.1 glycosyltransferase family 4 protein [Citrobacter freundii]
MKKIAILIWGLHSSAGTERVAVNISNQLCKNSNISVNLISMTGLNSFYKIDSSVNVNFLNCNGTLFPYLSAVNFLKKNKFDTVIVISMGKLSVITTLLKILRGIRSKWILSEHISFSKYSFLQKFIKRVTYYFADKVILLTRYDKNLISKTNKKFMVIENSSPFTISLNVNENATRVIAVGRLTYQKGYDRLLDIWAEFCRHNPNFLYPLEIYGNGELKESLILKCNELKISKRVIFHESVQNIEDVYKSAYCLLMTSRFEGLPMVLIESKSFGVPVISFNCKTGPDELINDEVDGYLVKDGDEKAFLEKMNLLLNDRKLRNVIAANALLSAQKYSSNKISSMWLDII